MRHPFRGAHALPPWVLHGAGRSHVKPAGLNAPPCTGEKHSNWEGGFRAASFVSGGFLAANLRGTHNNIVFHIVDWCVYAYLTVFLHGNRLCQLVSHLVEEAGWGGQGRLY